MRHLLLYILLTIFTVEYVSGQSLHKIEKEGLYGYADSLGAVVIEPAYKFVYTESFQNIAFITKGKDIIAINKSEKHLFKVFNYDNGPDYIEEGLFRIVDDKGLIGFSDTLGNIIIKPQYKFAFPFEDGKAKVTNKGRSKAVGEHSYWKSRKWYFIEHPLKKIRNSKLWIL